MILTYLRAVFFLSFPHFFLSHTNSLLMTLSEWTIASTHFFLVSTCIQSYPLAFGSHVLSTSQLILMPLLGDSSGRLMFSRYSAALSKTCRNLARGWRDSVCFEWPNTNKWNILEPSPGHTVSLEIWNFDFRGCTYTQVYSRVPPSPSHPIGANANLVWHNSMWEQVR